MACGGGSSGSTGTDAKITTHTTPFRYPPGHASYAETILSETVPAFPFILSAPWETTRRKSPVIRLPHQHDGSPIGSNGEGKPMRGYRQTLFMRNPGDGRSRPPLRLLSCKHITRLFCKQTVCVVSLRLPSFFREEIGKRWHRLRTGSRRQLLNKLSIRFGSL